MKHWMCAAGALALTGVAHAQSSVTLYGLIDTSLRYTTHENANGSGKLQMTEGLLTGSRWGLRADEDLGGGRKAFTQLESGFGPDTGTSLQGGRLFGRTALVGLKGDWGTVTLGRQYTVAHDVMSSYESMALANVSIVGYQGGNYTGLRQDNLLKYTYTLGPWQTELGYTFGEVPGATRAGSTAAAALIYAQGPLMLAGVFQQSRDVTTSFFGLSIPASRQNLWSAGGTYQLGKSMLYFGFTSSALGVADYRNRAVYIGAKVPLTPALTFITTLTGDRLKHQGDGGNRFTGAAALDYSFSKRTDVYASVDYTSVRGAWSTLASLPNFATPFFGYSSRLGVMAGLRHKF